ncbi:hypothetical protein JXA40_09940 [bacterium]|nr:hypothetical protein [candidate division CSSED10-310 bacterium]
MKRKNTRSMRILSMTAGLFLISLGMAYAGTFDLELETGSVWFTRNDIRIPGDIGTQFDMMDLTGSSPDGYLRLHAVYGFNEYHALRITLAPLKVEGTGTLDQDVFFQDSRFEKNRSTTGTFQFNTYRLTYRWMFHLGVKWNWGIGGALLVRDAEVALRQGMNRASNDDLGLVPLLHLYGLYRFGEWISVVLDAEGAGSSQGRAIDAAVRFEHAWPSGWRIFAGYRVLEGGADNDSVYTFAWLHHAVAGAGYRF